MKILDFQQNIKNIYLVFIHTAKSLNNNNNNKNHIVFSYIYIYNKKN